MLESAKSAYDEFQSTRPVRGATGRWSAKELPIWISIHAPRAGRDGCWRAPKAPTMNFNPRAPCGARLAGGALKSFRSGFQSTRPVRGATFKRFPRFTSVIPFQSTRPVRGATRTTCLRKLRNLFQSTRPVRGATLQVCPSASYSVISIHAPRAGRDHNGKCKPAETVGISIHAPRAGRDLAGGALKSFRSGFQSTRPVRGATARQAPPAARYNRFQSTRPVRGATIM